jgi:chromosome segregation protein
MKLTTLDLLGFKSFLHRIPPFRRRRHCIVGPNGCGKSNIVDAISWVLGERGTKSLRGKEMGDVIFHGTSARRQVNMAEVTMGLMNEGREYAIRRRIYRDGTNEYYINGEMVRLKDVQDFFLGTGVGLHSYAIIEQGNIDYFTQMKPQDRRMAVEETSGITRFEEKKKDALFRMEQVKANLERVEDVYREVTRNEEKAEEESARLRAHNDLRQKLREFDIALLADGLARLERKGARLGEREEALSAEAGRNEEQRRNAADSARAKGEEIALIDRATRQMELEIKGKEKDIESRLLELTYLEGEKKRLQREASDLRAEVETFDRRIAGHRRDVQGLEQSIGRESATLAELERQARDMEVRREKRLTDRATLERAVEKERNDLFGAMTSLTEARNAILERERASKEREARIRRRAEEEKLLTGKLRGLEEKASSLRQRMEQEATAKAGLDLEEKEMSGRCEAVTSEAEALRRTLEGLKGEKRGKEEVLRHLARAEQPRKTSNPYPRLIDLLKHSPDTERVMERFFPGETEYHVLTEQDPYNLSIIAKEYADNFVFFPKKGMFRLDGGEADIRIVKVEGPAEAFRRIDGGEEGLFLAGGVIIDSRGLVRRTSGRAMRSITEARERKKLESELAEIEGQIVERSARLDELLATRKDLEKGLEAVRGKRRAGEKAMASSEREMIANEAETKSARERLAERPAASDDAGGEEDAGVPASMLEEKERWEREKERIEGLLSGMKKDLEEAKEDCARIDADFHRTSIEIERSGNRLKQDREAAARKGSAIETLLREQEARRRRLAQTDQDLHEMAGKASGLEKECGLLQEECAVAVTRYEEMKGRLGEAHIEKTALEEKLKALGEEAARIGARREAVERERLVIREKDEAIRRRLREDYGVEEVPRDAVPASIDEAERERIIERLAAIGEVNFRAEKEAAELKERRAFLETQKTDLNEAMESLRKTIARIDSVSRDLFLETFERVNTAFRDFTQTLFRGGQGTLMLNEASGIDLYVQPPGKKVTRIELSPAERRHSYPFRSFSP